MTVFISYRRSASKHLARLIFSELRARGYDVFLDVTTIDSGAFDSIILNQIAARPHFLLVLSPGSLERCANEGDWLRREIEEALRLKRNIVPIFDEGFNLDQEKQFLPEPLHTELPRLNAPPYSHYYFDAFMEAVCNRFLRLPEYEPVIIPTPATDHAEVQQRIELAANVSTSGTTPARSQFTLPLLEWINIPAGRVKLEENAGVYDVVPFAMAKYPITNAQFQAFIDDNGYQDDHWWQGLARRIELPKKPRWSEPTHPHETVSWYESVAFTRWLSHKIGLSITLPTEIQWQWAAVGDTGWAYPYGTTFDTNLCNTSESGINKTTSVNHYDGKVQDKTKFGVMDMSGNVWEWCLNLGNEPASAKIDSDNPRSLRGGSWNNLQGDARAAFRGWRHSDRRSLNLGFRVCCTTPVLMNR